MNPNIIFIIGIAYSIILGATLAILWARLSLYLGTIIKKHINNSGLLISSNLCHSSNHGRKARQYYYKQIKATNGIKGVYQSNNHWIMFLVYRVIQPFYWYLNGSPYKRDKYSCTHAENNTRYLKPLIQSHNDNLAQGKDENNHKQTEPATCPFDISPRATYN